MREFEHSYNILLKILEEGLPFNLAIKSSLKKEKKQPDNDFKIAITASVGCVLRHYLVFKEIFLKKYPEESEAHFLLFALGLGNHLFSKRFDEKELNKFIVKESGLEDLPEFINSFDDPNKLIPEEITYNSKKYYSLRYNLPLWIVNMWERFTGDFLSKKLFRSISHRAETIARVNTQDISFADFLKKYSDFEGFDEELGLVKLTKESALKRNPAIKNNDALMIQAGYSYMLKNLDIDPIRGIAIYSGGPNQLLEELTLRLGPTFKADYLCGKENVYFDINNYCKYHNLKNVSLYECDYQSIITCISKPVHTFFLCPENTYFLGLLERPDYFLTCKQEELDRLINGQKQALLEASKQVEDGGDLVYFIPTFCKNEGKGIIHKFLEGHQEFTLVEEKQLFPFDKYESMLYFAILRKEVSHD